MSEPYVQDKLTGLCQHGNNLTACAVCNEAGAKSEKAVDGDMVRIDMPGEKSIYSRDFQELIENRPSLIEDINYTTEIADKAGRDKSIENAGIKLVLIHSRNYSRSYCMEINGKVWFLKKELGGRDSVQSFEDTLEAKRRFSNTPWVKVVENKLAHTDQQRGKDLIISEWKDLKHLAYYMEHAFSDLEREEVAYKLEFIYRTLADYTPDLTPENMFYDPGQKIIYLFDLRKKQPADRSS